MSGYVKHSDPERRRIADDTSGWGSSDGKDWRVVPERLLEKAVDPTLKPGTIRFTHKVGEAFEIVEGSLGDVLEFIAQLDNRDRARHAVDTNTFFVPLPGMVACPTCSRNPCTCMQYQGVTEDHVCVGSSGCAAADCDKL